MKFAYISDIHVDSYCSSPNKLNDTFFNIFFDKLFNIDSECLIIAGDIANRNDYTINFLDGIKSRYNFKHIFFVFGNHDFYLINKKDMEKYSFNSELRKKDLQEYFNNDNIIHILDDDVFELDGIKIGGAGGWYDGSYTSKLNPRLYKDNIININNLWMNYSNDFNYILDGVRKEIINNNNNFININKNKTHEYKAYKYNNFLNIFNKEYPKIINVLENNVDIMITHYPPLSEGIMYDDVYKTDINGGFYSFDGEDLIDQYKPKYWVCGHMHNESIVEVYGTKILRNPMGYKGEIKAHPIRVFEI